MTIVVLFIWTAVGSGERQTARREKNTTGVVTCAFSQKTVRGERTFERNCCAKESCPGILFYTFSSNTILINIWTLIISPEMNPVSPSTFFWLVVQDIQIIIRDISSTSKQRWEKNDQILNVPPSKQIISWHLLILWQKTQAGNHWNKWPDTKKWQFVLHIWGLSCEHVKQQHFYSSFACI